MSTQLLRLPRPSPASLAHRQHIAQTISPLKRVRPHVPFWKLGAHRIPTLWTLYRGLLKHTGNDNVCRCSLITASRVCSSAQSVASQRDSPQCNTIGLTRMMTAFLCLKCGLERLRVLDSLAALLVDTILARVPHQTFPPVFIWTQL